MPCGHSPWDQAEACGPCIDARMAAAGVIIRDFLNGHQHRKARHQVLCPLCVRAKAFLEVIGFPRSVPTPAEEGTRTARRPPGDPHLGTGVP
jgi:hypothetical protein